MVLKWIQNWVPYSAQLQTTVMVDCSTSGLGMKPSMGLFFNNWHTHKTCVSGVQTNN